MMALRIVLFLICISQVFGENSITVVQYPDPPTIGGKSIITWTYKAGQDYDAGSQKLYLNGTSKSNKIWDLASPQDMASLRHFGAKTQISSSKPNITLTIPNVQLNYTAKLIMRIPFVDENDQYDIQYSPIEFKPVDPKLDPETTDAPGTSDSNSGAVIGGVIAGVIVLVIVIIAIVFICKKKKRDQGINRKSGTGDATDFSYQREATNQYAPVGTGVDTYQPPEQKSVENPPQAKYSQLGPGGRNGPKDHVTRTQYAEAKPHPDHRKSSTGSDDNQFTSGIIV